MTPVRLEPAAPQYWVKHSTTEPLYSLQCGIKPEPVRCANPWCFTYTGVLKGHVWWRKVQTLCVIQVFKDSSNGMGKLLKLLFRLHFRCPFEMWVEIPPNTKRTNNVADSFHVHLNTHFYTAHPTIFVFF